MYVWNNAHAARLRLQSYIRIRSEAEIQKIVRDIVRDIDKNLYLSQPWQIRFKFLRSLGYGHRINVSIINTNFSNDRAKKSISPAYRMLLNRGTP